MRKYLFTFVRLPLLTLQINAAANDYTVKEQTGVIKTSTVDFNIKGFNSRIIRIVRFPSGGSESKVSLSVIKVPEKTKFKVTETEGVITIETSLLKVSSNLSGA